MSGESFNKGIKMSLCAALAVALIVSQKISTKKLKTIYSQDPTINQYLNRLVEFFDTQRIDQAEDEFLNMIDFGVLPRDAFSILVFNGELN